jgi:phage terminase large subunit
MNPISVKQFSKKFEILLPSCKKTFKGLRGGRASGKSWAAIRQLVVLSNQYHMFIVCARAYWTNIANSAYKLVVDTINSLGIEHLYIITDKYIEHKITGSKFIFIGLNTNPAGVKSTEGAHVVFVEEGEQVCQEAWDLLIPTIIRKKGAQIWCAWNRDLPTTPVEAVFADNEDCVVIDINYDENPHIPEKMLAEIERMKVKDLAKYQWIYMGMYRPTGSTTWIDLQYVMGAFDRGTLADPDKAIVAGLDLGFMRDRSVMVVMQGDRILDVKIWNNADPMILCDEIIGYFAHHNVSYIGVDCLGPGVPVISRLSEGLGDRVFPIGYGEAATDDEQYVNLRSEAWGMIKDWLPNGHIPSGMNNEWITDLCNIRYGYDFKGRYAIEAKKLYISRGFPSTDISDALGLALCVPNKIRKDKKTLSRHKDSRSVPSDY